MSSFREMRKELEETTIAKRIGLAHVEARDRYKLKSYTVKDFDEFSHVIGEYYNYHFTTCVSKGGRLPAAEATGEAKEIVTQQYRRRNQDIVKAYEDCRDGTNGGLVAVLNIIADALKAKSIENYTRDVFDRYVAPCSWEQKVEIIRELIQDYRFLEDSSIEADKPEKYAHNYEQLIKVFVSGLRETSSAFRSL